MKSNRPVSDFFMRMQSFKANDVAVLFAMVALYEITFETGLPISPAAKTRIWAVEIPQEQLAESIDRLIELGEIVWVEEEIGGSQVHGYRVVRFDELHSGLSKLGNRAYWRKKKAESRNVECEEVVA